MNETKLTANFRDREHISGQMAKYGADIGKMAKNGELMIEYLILL